MRAITIEESFEQFVTEPTPGRWHELRERILASDAYDPYGSSWRRVDALIEARRFAEAHELAGTLEPWACLSPRWHFWMGVSALENGDPLMAGEHREWLRICLEALLDSGDGSPDAPYRVLYPSDAYDVLQAIGEKAAGQRLLEDTQGARDLLTAESGEDYWFDVADMLARCVPPRQEEFAGASPDGASLDSEDHGEVSAERQRISGRAST